METENLNLMTRGELIDSMKTLSPHSQAGAALRTLLDSRPATRALDPGKDLFEISFSSEIVEDISFAVEQYAFDNAEEYVQAMDEKLTTSGDDARFYYWQALSEKWGYLEVAGDS